MKLIRLVTALLIAGNFTIAEEPPTFKVDQLADQIYKFTIDGGGYDVKVIASIGADGILLVDTGQKGSAEALKELVLSYGKGLPKYIIFTHAHVEHTAGNYIFGPEPVLIGHDKLRTRLRSGSYLFDEFPDHSIPELTFDKSLTLNFNGEEIRLLAFPGGHDDSDIVVWFSGSRVACIGALANGHHFPSIDGNTGDIMKYPGIAHAVYDILPPDVTIVPGHGADGTMADFARFNNMLDRSFALVKQGIDAGQDLAALQQANILGEFADFGGSYTSLDRWIKYIYDGYTEPAPGKDRKSLYDPIYYAIRDEGASAAVELYQKLKREAVDEYYFRDNFPLFVGYKLYNIGRYAEALPFLQLDVKEFPGTDYEWLSYYYLGLTAKETGDIKLARKSLKQALKLNPDEEDIKTSLAELD
ncbi:MAG: tetratricopeptide repeat protein [Candidatus Neomarinimicrobiota bacterium]